MSAFLSQITPAETVRAGLALMFGVVLCWGFLTGRVNTVEFMTVVGGAVGYWFGRNSVPITPSRGPSTTTTTSLTQTSGASGGSS